MEAKTYDVLVVGGGINGAAAARDAALRGLAVALVEKHDFGWGTTATSTRLIHGGLRYLELMDFALVRESLREREVLLRQAPHLVRPLPFVVPVYRDSRRGPLAIKAGMILYDLLSYDKSMPRHKWYGRERLLELEPELNSEGLVGGALYYDAQVSFPERLCVEHAREAAMLGADVANYAEVVAIEGLRQGREGGGGKRAGGHRSTGDGGLAGKDSAGDDRIAATGAAYVATVKDRITGSEHRVKARIILNAAGPWADTLPKPSPPLRKTKGVHLVVPAFTNHAIVQIARSDGRVFFVIPWEGYSLVGTTDTDFSGDPGEATADEEDLDYLLRETQSYFPGVKLDPVYLTTAGVRPLVKAKEGQSESQVSRMHLVTDSDPGKGYGVVSILGGKITNHRSTVQEAVDMVCEKLGIAARCRTRETPLLGGAFDRGVTPQSAAESWIAEYASLGLPAQSIRRLAEIYGARAPEVLELCARDPALARPLVEGRPEIAAQVVFAAEREMCRRTSDFLLRRSGMGLLPHGFEAEEAVRAILSRCLGWDAQEEEKDRAQWAFESSRLAAPKSSRFKGDQGQGARVRSLT